MKEVEEDALVVELSEVEKAEEEDGRSLSVLGTFERSSSSGIAGVGDVDRGLLSPKSSIDRSSSNSASSSVFSNVLLLTLTPSILDSSSEFLVVASNFSSA